MKIFRHHRFLLAALMTLTVLACTKTKYNSDFDLPRQFKPGDISVSAGQTEAKLSWRPSLFTAGKNATYTVEVSTDSTFQTGVVFTTVTDTTTVTVTDSVLLVLTDYYARVKANANGPTAASGWVKSNSFRITGEQIFLPILDVDLKDTSVLLKWTPSAGLTTIKITPAGGSASVITLTPADVAANRKKINGLSPLTQYTAEIYKNNTRKGSITFTTKEHNIYAVTLSPGDDLVTAVANAANGDLIGLQPGTYNCTDGLGAYVNLVIQQKSITIQSTSNNPANTKVNFKEITLKGTGAGVTVRGIDWDGAASNASGVQASYFINLTGMASDADPSVFTDVKIENCRVHNMGNCLLRGNRAANNAHKIDTILVNNSMIYDNQAFSAYTFFTIDKLEFHALVLQNSTFYGFGRAFISYSTNITFPVAPSVLIDHCTINNFGRDGRNNFFIDANANPGTIAIQNSIIATTPMPGQTVGTTLVRASTASASLSYSDYFNLYDGAATPTALTWPSIVSQSNNQTIDLGWTAATTDFTLPAGSPLRTASSTNGAIGDLRWAQ